MDITPMQALERIAAGLRLPEILSCDVPISTAARDTLNHAKDAMTALPAAIERAVAPLSDYVATSPAEEIGEGYWGDLEQAYDCGDTAQQSHAAAIMRNALAALGFTPPAGRPFCAYCDRDLTEEHSPDCERPDNDEEEA